MAARGRKGGQRADDLCASSWRPSPESCSPTRRSGRRCYAVGGNERAASFAGINTRRVRFTALLISGDVRGLRRRDLRRLLSQLHSDRRAIARTRRHFLDHHRRRLDLRRLRHDDRLACRAQAVITLIRSLLVAADHPSRTAALSFCRSNGRMFSSALILIIAVVGDIWLRQKNILGAMVRQAQSGRGGDRRAVVEHRA